MPHPDPRPEPLPNPRHSTLQQFRRIMRLGALLSILVAGVAVAWVALGEDKAGPHALIATALGAGLTVLLGTALMTLSFLSSRRGHDDEAAHRHESDPE